MPTANFSNAVKSVPRDLEIKAGDCEVKSVDESGRFKIYFSVFGNVDRAKEIVEPGAYRNLAEFARTGWVGVNHQMDKLPVAMPLSATQDAKGLLVEGQFHTHPEAQACRTVILERQRAGLSVPGSVGYKVMAESQDTVGGERVRRLKSIDLYECSFVNLPANPRAELMSAKSMQVKPDEEEKDGEKEMKDVEVKAGRVLSRNTHKALMVHHKALEEHAKGLMEKCNTMKAWLDEHNPDSGDDDGDDDDGDGIEETKEPVNQRNAAGNSIPSDQNPHGEVTAEDIKARKEQMLTDFRARAARAQIQFALMK